MIQSQNSIRLKSLATRDLFKAKYIKERETVVDNLRKKRQNLIRLSSRRFRNSPFSTNFIGLNEIFEVNQKHKIFSKTSKNTKKFSRFLSKGEKVVKNSAKDIKNIEKVKNYTEKFGQGSFVLRQKSKPKENLRKKTFSEYPKSFSMNIKVKKL